MAVVLGVSACSSTSRSAEPGPDFARPVGIATAPLRPLLPSHVPSGWHLTDTSLTTTRHRGGTHALYLGPGATVRTGPAIIVGYTGDDQWTPLCSDGTSYPSRRWGHFTYVNGPEVEFVNDTATWALGRDVDEDALRRAVGAVHWATEDGPDPVTGVWRPEYSEIATTALPPGFRLAGTTDFGPGEPFSSYERLTYSTPHGDQVVNVANGNLALLTVARFWRDSLEPSCRSIRRQAPTFVVHGAVVTAFMRTPAVRDVIAALRPVSHREWRRTTGQTAASHPLTTCDDAMETSPPTAAPRPDAVFRSTHGSIRWILTLEDGRTCFNSRIDGHLEIADSGLPVRPGPGSHDVVLGPIQRLMDRRAPARFAVAGYVPATTRSVTVAVGGGEPQAAAVHDMADGRRAFGTLLRPEAALSERLTRFRDPELVVVALDQRGAEVGRWVSEPLLRRP